MIRMHGVSVLWNKEVVPYRNSLPEKASACTYPISLIFNAPSFAIGKDDPLAIIIRLWDFISILAICLAYSQYSSDWHKDTLADKFLRFSLNSVKS